MAIVHQLQAGNGVSVVPMHAELTTVEAAEMLNVSRPHLIKQLHLGALPFRMVGTHRRVRLVDLLAYRDAQDASYVPSPLVRRDPRRGATESGQTR